MNGQASFLHPILQAEKPDNVAVVPLERQGVGKENSQTK